MSRTPTTDAQPEAVTVAAGRVALEGDLGIPANACGIVLFAHGSGSGRHSPRNQYVAGQLRAAGLATLLIDLLTDAEGVLDEQTTRLRFDIPLLASRLAGAIDWLGRHPRTTDLRVGIFGASTGGGAALVAAARRPDRVGAVVSRGGRPDLADDDLPLVHCPTLLIVGGDDDVVIGLNDAAFRRLGSPVKHLALVPGAGHLFEEPGKLDEVARLAADWFKVHLASVEAS